MKMLRGWIVLTLATAIVVSASGRPCAAQSSDSAKELLKQIPAEAWGFVLIPSLEGMNSSINLYQQKIMGMPMMDLLQMLTLQLGIDAGLDTKGGAAVMALDMKKYGGQDAFAIVLKATDAKELLANFSPGEEADGLIPCEVQGETLYARTAGKFITIAKNKDVAKAIVASKESIESAVQGARLKMFQERTLSVAVALSKVVKGYREEIGGFTSMLAAMGGGAPSGEEEMKELVGQLEQYDWVDLSLGLDKTGVAISLLTHPRSGTDMDKAAREMKGIATTLTGLPGGPFVLAMGMELSQGPESRKQIEKQINSQFNRLLETPEMKENEKLREKTKDIKNGVGELTKLVERIAFSVSPLSDGPDGLLAANIVIGTSDAEKLMKVVGGLIATGKAMMAENEDAKKVMGAIEHKAGVETIESVKVDQLVIDPTKSEELDMDDEDMESARKIVGKDGFSLRFGAVGTKSVVFTIGGGKSHFADVAKSAKSGESGLTRNEGITKIGAGLPKSKYIEMYLSVEEGAKMFKRIARALGEDDPIPSVPTIAEPVALMGTVEGAVTRVDFVIPMDVIQGVRNMVTGAMAAQRYDDRGAKKDDGDEDEDEDEEDE